jgi:hypothetical protein
MKKNGYCCNILNYRRKLKRVMFLLDRIVLFSVVLDRFAKVDQVESTSVLVNPEMILDGNEFAII